MPDKKNPSEVMEDNAWQTKAQPSQTTKKIKAKVTLIIPHNRVIVEYGQGLGTEIKYDEAKHKSLKLGDMVDI